MTQNKKNYKSGFTLAEIMVTLAVMGIVLALVVSFSVLISKATQARTKNSETLSEIEHLNTVITDWFYAYDSEDYTVAGVSSGSEEEFVYDYMNDTAIRVNTNTVTIQDANFIQMISGGIVPANHVLTFSIDGVTFKPAVKAGYSADGSKDVSIGLNYITDVTFDWNEELGLLKCTYIFGGDKDASAEDAETDISTYTLLLYKHTGA